MEYSHVDKLPEDCELLSVGLGKHGDKHVVILSYIRDAGDNDWNVNIIELDMSTKREVPAKDVMPYHIKKGHLLK